MLYIVYGAQLREGFRKLNLRPPVMHINIY